MPALSQVHDARSYGFDSLSLKMEALITLVPVAWEKQAHLCMFWNIAHNRIRVLRSVSVSHFNSELLRQHLRARIDSEEIQGDPFGLITKEELLHVDIMPHGTTINSDGYVATLKKLQVRLNRVRRHREKQDVLLLHDNAQPYVSHKAIDQIRKFG
ncbi:hypothetical protein ANN_26455 [Periplaneta americana]|uniref:Mariner Mos1 transposase n=1 Tax=Periplaneta americana TaxID=6978 RepID=A0ABQ8RY45_PERAM|nr:hypothetical protein ANN_26455 [Periplaneta americana]